MRYVCFGILLLTACAWAQQSPSAQKPVVPEISADLGSCTVDFTIADMAGKPIYAAKVHTLIRYGFMNKRKTDLEAYTSAEGKVRFTNMPEQSKNPIPFDISFHGDTAHISYDPSTSCHAKYDVPLRAATKSKK